VEKGVVEQQQEQAQEDKLFEIPQDFETWHEALLVATQADWVRGVVKDIKCRLCPVPYPPSLSSSMNTNQVSHIKVGKKRPRYN